MASHDCDSTAVSAVDHVAAPEGAAESVPSSVGCVKGAEWGGNAYATVSHHGTGAEPEGYCVSVSRQNVEVVPAVLEGGRSDR